MTPTLKKELFKAAETALKDKVVNSYIELEEWLESYMDENHPNIYSSSNELMDICDDVYAKGNFR